jgi:putative transposase
VPVHVVHRGIDRNDVFFDDRDRVAFLRALADGLERYAVRLHAYVLMDNHIHLLLTPDRPQAVSSLMCYLGGRYVPQLNRRAGRTGNLWAGRHFSAPIQEDRYLIACMRYIEMNPVRASIVRHAGAYRWSSFRANAFGMPDRIVDPHAVYLALGPDRDACRRAYESRFTACAVASPSIAQEASELRAQLRRRGRARSSGAASSGGQDPTP